jgi:CBS domain-containing protein
MLPVSEKKSIVLVKDLMDPEVPTVKPEATLAEAYRFLLDNNVIGACVVTEDGQFAGYVSEGDFIRATIPSATDIAIYESIITEKQLPEQMVRNLRFTKVEDIMTPNLVTIGADEPILNALALLHVHGLKRLPVLDGNMLVGTISRATILKNLLLDRELS